MDEIGLQISLMKTREYDRLDGKIKDSMKRSASEVVRLGYFLRRMMEEKLYQVYYIDFNAYLLEELHIDYTTVNRFIGINKKYSVSGRSEDIDEKYAEYSQGLLIEMLSMSPELEKQVTPDMTVKQAREIKRAAKQKNIAHKPEVRGLMDHPYCSSCGTPLDEDVLPGRCPECGQLQDWSQYRRMIESQKVSDNNTVIEGEYREVEEPEEVATSQFCEEVNTEIESAYGLAKSVYPEGSLIAMKGCGHKYNCFSCAQDCNIRQEDRYCRHAPLGNPFSCATMETTGILKTEMGDKCQFINNDLADHTAGSNEASPCCRNCSEELCRYRCQRASGSAMKEETAEPKEVQDAEEQPGAEPELLRVRDILRKEQALLHDYIEAGGIPESTVYRQKIIVDALANMLGELESAEEKENAAVEMQQPELPTLKNNDQRKEWLGNYKNWGLWYRDENIDVNYYKYDFNDGSRLVVEEYPQRCQYWDGKKRDEAFYHLLEKNKQGYKKTYDEVYRHTADSETYLVEFLKKLQKKGDRA